MSDFNRDYLDQFLGVLRKYMQMRGNLTQKDLSELLEVGESSLSRFMNSKTSVLDPQLIATIVARLDIPIHEIVDFLEEEYTPRFRKLVKFLKDERLEAGQRRRFDDPPPGELSKDDFTEGISGGLGTAQKDATATVKVAGRNNTIHFQADKGSKNSQESIRDKIAALSPRQKAYLSDFLNLDVESKDLIVDVGNSLFRYFRQKGLEL